MFRDPYYSNLFSWLPDLLLGIIVLIIGFIIAKVAEGAVVKAMRKGRVNERLNMQHQKWSADRIASKIVFFGILLLTILIFFNMMNLNTITSPFLNVFAGLSGAVLGILKAGLILLLAWVLATLVKKLILSAGHKVNVHKYVSKVGGSAESVDKAHWISTAANVAFYLILLLFIPAVLNALGLSGVSGPFENLLTGFVAFVPKLVGAALIFVVGILIAKIVRMIVTKLLESIGTDKIASKLNMSSAVKGTSISKVIGTIVFVLILIPVTISALEVLDLEGISQPAIAMLNDIMVMLPKIIVAIVLILVGVFVAKWMKGVVETLLANLGVDSLSNKMGVKSTNRSGSFTVSSVIGTIVQIVVILLFVVEALQIVQLAFMVTLATAIFAYLPMVLAAVLILAVGFWLANLAEKFIGSVMQTKQGNPHILRYVAKYAILAFAFFMALSQLGIAPAIINAAFILILGGVALAFGLAFGLGGRDHASRYLSKMESSLQDVDVSKESWEQQKEEMKQDAEQAKQQAKDGMAATKAQVEQEKEQIKRTTEQAPPVPPSDNIPGDPEAGLRGPAHSDVNDLPPAEKFGGNDPITFTDDDVDTGYNEVEPGEDYPYGDHNPHSRFNKEAHEQWNNQKPKDDQTH
ncbi:mechanosensitive ion channel [Sporosarcina aquimarina]|uniref:mechanosensitive ion channel n=1 Tax=Sporosarcina aquimarina TaxID=114975 RepID=UPI00203DF9F1|nr:mechanosensitive ion channel [Sporosarcina aquimarina]MCM3755920.1 mechanosensitive ion channel [Sporosarcina aquimarina]